MDPRTRHLLEAPIGSTLLRLAAPNVLVMLVQASIGLIETYFVAGLGTDALAGMALVFPLVMLMTMITAGAMGGGIMSAISRTLGAGRVGEANGLVWHAALIATVLGLASTLGALLFGERLYALMGGRDASLAAATAYSHVVFAGALFVWLFNSLAAVIRGTGNMILPAAVMCVGAVVLIPLSPVLIFSWGPVPGLGIVGGGIALVGYYLVGTIVFAAYLWSGRGVLHPAPRPPRISWAAAWVILRVGLVSSMVSLTSNITIMAATAFVGVAGPAAVAGFGTGSRLEYLLVPLVFGFGAPIGAMVGTAIGAGDRARALRVAWTGATLAGLLTEVIGMSAAIWPEAWLRLFGDDPLMLATGSQYLRITGPFYGAFGFGLALYFASQGAGRVGWTLVAGLARVAVAVGGGWFAVHVAGGTAGIFLSLGLGILMIGIVNAASIKAGVWFRPTRREAARQEAERLVPDAMLKPGA